MIWKKEHWSLARIIRMCRALPKNIISLKLIDQIVRSGTSIGANYRVANETITKKDFRNKIVTSLKEAKETIYWLDLIIEASPEFANRILLLRKENTELVKIFAKILENSKMSLRFRGCSLFVICFCGFGIFLYLF